MRKSIDLVVVLMIFFGIIILNSKNNLGWLFILGGILKWALEK